MWHQIIFPLYAEQLHLASTISYVLCFNTLQVYYEYRTVCKTAPWASTISNISNQILHRCTSSYAVYADCSLHNLQDPVSAVDPSWLICSQSASKADLSLDLLHRSAYSAERNGDTIRYLLLWKQNSGRCNSFSSRYVINFLPISTARIPDCKGTLLPFTPNRNHGSRSLLRFVLAYHSNYYFCFTSLRISTNKTPRRETDVLSLAFGRTCCQDLQAGT